VVVLKPLFGLELHGIKRGLFWQTLSAARAQRYGSASRRYRSATPQHGNVIPHAHHDFRGRVFRCGCRLPPAAHGIVTENAREPQPRRIEHA
jgi:hypothetical protein